MRRLRDYRLTLRGLREQVFSSFQSDIHTPRYRTTPQGGHMRSRDRSDTRAHSDSVIPATGSPLARLIATFFPRHFAQRARRKLPSANKNFRCLIENTRARVGGVESLDMELRGSGCIPHYFLFCGGVLYRVLEFSLFTRNFQCRATCRAALVRTTFVDSSTSSRLINSNL